MRNLRPARSLASRVVLTVLAAQTATQCRPLGGHDYPRREEERELEQLPPDDG